MIISASRRTDIPAYYWDWFLGRLNAGFVCVRNPRNSRSISQISLDPSVVDGFVFWTKNPGPALNKLCGLRDFMYYFQFTLTGYGQDLEPGLPDKDQVLVPAFQRLSDLLGPKRVIWRYDPILLTEKYTVDWHIRRYEQLAKALSPYTRRCVISFLDYYQGTARRLSPLSPVELTGETQRFLAKSISEIARGLGLQVETCCENIPLAEYGIRPGRCIDPRLFEELLQCPVDGAKDKNQRPNCGCMQSIDLGAYDTCQNGCLYCYANHSEKALLLNVSRHDPASPLLTGHIGPEDKINLRQMKPSAITQLMF